MAFRAPWSRAAAPSRLDRGRTSGRPPSGNGASSFHLWWEVESGPWVEAEAVLEVLVPPSVPDLHFWALQVSFLDRGRSVGGAHTGLQWNRAAPGGAVNWGGYADAGGELTGTRSTLPAADAGPNTVRWPWAPVHPHRLHIARVGAGRWRSTVTDLTDGRSAVIRDLLVDADALASPVVWSEVFADCAAPSTTVRWSDLRLRAGDGREAAATAVTTSFQSDRDGGCANTDVVLDDVGVRQVTAVARSCQHGAHLPLHPAT